MLKKKYSSKPATNTKQDSSKAVLLDVEISVPPDQSASLKLLYGDSIMKEVRKFAKKWNINEETEEQIFDQISRHLMQASLFNHTEEGRGSERVKLDFWGNRLPEEL